MPKQSAIWVTGASSGIGRATASHFAKSGHTVVASARRVCELESLKFELSKEKTSLHTHPCDVSSFENLQKNFAAIESQFEVDCLVNNAGVTSFTPAENDSIEELHRIFQINLMGAIYAIKLVLPGMIARKRGTIINISSVVTQKIFTHSSAYSASKWGLLGYTNVLREELRQHAIRVINIVPGATETPMWAPDMRDQYSQRMMKSEDVAHTISWAYSQPANVVPEEICMRPIQGDL